MILPLLALFAVSPTFSDAGAAEKVPELQRLLKEGRVEVPSAPACATDAEPPECTDLWKATCDARRAAGTLGETLSLDGAKKFNDRWFQELEKSGFLASIKSDVERAASPILGLDGDQSMVKTSLFLKTASPADLLNEELRLMDGPSPLFKCEGPAVTGAIKAGLSLLRKNPASPPKTAVGLLKILQADGVKPVTPGACEPEPSLTVMKDLLVACFADRYAAAEKNMSTRKLRSDLAKEFFPAAEVNRVRAIYKAVVAVAAKSVAASSPEGASYVRSIYLVYPYVPSGVIQFRDLFWTREAAFSAIDQELQVGGGFRDYPEHTLAFVFAHELGHSLMTGPLGIPAGLAKAMPDQVKRLQDCLVKPDAAGAKDSQLQETIADWFGAEFFKRYLESRNPPLSPEAKKQAIRDSVTSCQDLKRYRCGFARKYLRDDTRMNRVLMADPYFRSAFSCATPAPVMHCEAPFFQ